MRTLSRMNPCLAQGCREFVAESPLGHTHKPPEWLDGHIDGSFVVVVDHLQAQAVVDFAHPVGVCPGQGRADVAE